MLKLIPLIWLILVILGCVLLTTIMPIIFVMDLITLVGSLVKLGFYSFRRAPKMTVKTLVWSEDSEFSLTESLITLQGRTLDLDVRDSKNNLVKFRGKVKKLQPILKIVEIVNANKERSILWYEEIEKVSV